MTIEEFLVELKNTPGPWHIENGRYIRLVNEDACGCPVVVVHKAITGKRLASMRFQLCGEGLEMTVTQLLTIAEAADKDQGYDKDLRAKLLAACNLEEAA